MNIRVATQDDVETLFEIRISVAENYQSREELKALGITPASVAAMLDTNCRAWVAEIDYQPVGFSLAHGAEAKILGLFVRPEFEGRGIGRKLMQTTEHWLWSQNNDEIWLLTDNDPQLRAYGFYQHLGWSPAGIVTEGNFQGEMRFTKKRVDH